MTRRSETLSLAPCTNKHSMFDHFALFAFYKQTLNRSREIKELVHFYKTFTA